MAMFDQDEKLKEVIKNNPDMEEVPPITGDWDPLTGVTRHNTVNPDSDRKIVVRKEYKAKTYADLVKECEELNKEDDQKKEKSTKKEKGTKRKVCRERVLAKDIPKHLPAIKGGRRRDTKPKIFDYETFEKLCHMQCTSEEICEFLAISKPYLIKKVKEHYGVAQYIDAYNKLAMGGKVSIRRSQFNLSRTNTAMAIWLGKQYLGQAENRGPEKAPLVIEQVVYGKERKKNNDTKLHSEEVSA